MSQEKTIDILRRRNVKLQSEIDKLKAELEAEKRNKEKVSETIQELNELKDKWKNELEIINDQRKQYSEFIYNLKSLEKIKKVMEK